MGAPDFDSDGGEETPYNSVRAQEAKRAQGLTRISKWLSVQSNNLDPLRREAASHVMSRWEVADPYFNPGRVLRTLTREQSPYLTGFQLLLDDYRTEFHDDKAIREIGAAGPFTPVEIILCAKCSRTAVAGSDLCAKHGGQFLTPEDQQRISAHTAQMLTALTSKAVGALDDLMDNAKSEKVRFDAASRVLELAGIGPGMRITIDDSGAAQRQREAIEARIVQMRDSLLASVKMKELESAPADSDDTADIVDADLVDEEEPQPHER